MLPVCLLGAQNCNNPGSTGAQTDKDSNEDNVNEAAIVVPIVLTLIILFVIGVVLIIWFRR